MKQTFESIPRSLIALETGTHCPWVSRLLRELGHEVLVAHARKVQLISKSNRKDDRHDARTLARLARIDPELLHRLWVSGEVYEPLRNSHKALRAVA
jgi:transposase